MTTLKQQEMLLAKRLYLPRDRRLRYYFDTFIISRISLFIFALFARDLINRESYNNFQNILIFLIFPVIALLIFFHQKNSLRFLELNTSFSKMDNNKLVKETLSTLQWQIKIDNQGFLEDYTDTGILSWSEHMFSIFITDNKILFNSMCNVDDYAVQAITWGQNTKNMRCFKEAFEIIATKHISQHQLLQAGRQNIS